MKYARKPWGPKELEELLQVGRKQRFFSFLALTLVGVALLTACERGAHLTVENRMPVDVTIIHDGINQSGAYLGGFPLGTVPAGQTVTLRKRTLGLRQDLIGWTVILKAEDPSGKIVWQKSWSFHEFLQLEKVGWRITVSPETSAPIQ